MLGKEKYVGKIETGKVFEQPIMVVDNSGKEHQFRRIRVLLKKATRDGDKEIFIITNLPKKAAGAKKIAEIYRSRWTIETSFQELEKWFNSEINTLGYPPAALFGFCVASDLLYDSVGDQGRISRHLWRKIYRRTSVRLLSCR